LQWIPLLTDAISHRHQQPQYSFYTIVSFNVLCPVSDGKVFYTGRQTILIPMLICKYYKVVPNPNGQPPEIGKSVLQDIIILLTTTLAC